VRRTKIVATIGPACDTTAALTGLLDAGVDVCRIGLAHGTPPEHLDRIARIRDVASGCGRPVAVLGDLPGPKVRAAEFPDGGVFLAEGDEVALVAGDGGSTAERIEVEYPAFADDLRIGDAITLGDGLISLRAVGRDGEAWRTVVVAGGRTQGRPGVHLPAERLRLPTPTPHDLELLDALAPAMPDIVAVSFVRSAADIRAVREVVAGGPGGGPMLVAKIETRAAVEALPEILDVADAVMVARGDLGIDCPVEEVPHLQKQIIRRCVAAGVPVITATQMLESMVHSPLPTRAEASDVANAVLDGTDAVMLSGETAIGHDPELAVRTMARIVEQAERHADYLAWGGRLGKLQRAAPVPESLAITAAVTNAAWEVAVDLDAAAVVCCTRSGRTARAMARFRPPCPLLAFSPDPGVQRRLALSWGVTPLDIDLYGTADEMVWNSVERTVQQGFARVGDIVVVLVGSPESVEAASDVLRVVRVR
jgi:pyruvate kinase